MTGRRIIFILTTSLLIACQDHHEIQDTISKAHVLGHKQLADEYDNKLILFNGTTNAAVKFTSRPDHIIAIQSLHKTVTSHLQFIDSLILNLPADNKHANSSSYVTDLFNHSTFGQRFYLNSIAAYREMEKLAMSKELRQQLKESSKVYETANRKWLFGSLTTSAMCKMTLMGVKIQILDDATDVSDAYVPKNNR